MTKFLGAILLTMTLLASAARAEAPAMPGPASGNLARIYVYRDFGSYQYLNWTAVWFNDERVGDSAPGTYFYRDVRPGTYTINLRSERPYPDQFKTVTVAPGSVTFVKVWAIDDYAVSVPPVHTHHMHFDGLVLSLPNTFVDTVMAPAVALPEIARLQPM